MRGRKLSFNNKALKSAWLYKKRIPEWGDGNVRNDQTCIFLNEVYKKRIPEWGDGNRTIYGYKKLISYIKKESPNEGTETPLSILAIVDRDL